MRDALRPEQASLEEALKQPYFGRLDFDRIDTKGVVISRDQIIYIGANVIYDENVHSWTAPVARLWYTDDPGYDSPTGYKAVRLNLKRFLRIRDLEIIEINDIYRRLLPFSPEDGKSPLVEALSATGRDEGHLQVIVETIEPDQYEAIANQKDRTLIVQGAAGSGKSEIGLHRIAYLLSPFNEISESERPTPETTLFVGPSQSFLEYAGDVLPNLGVQSSVRQTTFKDWLREHRTSRPRLLDDTWNELLNRGQLLRFDEDVERFKGSLAMSDALDRHVRKLRTKVRIQCRTLPSQVELESGLRIEVNQELMRSMLDRSLSDLPDGYRLNSRRLGFIRGMTDAILAATDDGQVASHETGGRRRRVERWIRRRFRRDSREDSERHRRAAARVVSEWCAESWPRFNVRKEYVALLGDSDLLLCAARGSLSSEHVQALRKSSERMLTAGFLDSDEGALTYLDHLLNGTIEPRYRHIVVDEAQDISPIEFKLLSLASTNNWFTVLGDLAQRLTPHRGIHRWRSLDRVLGRSDISVQHARTSYRSNKHITRFNNRILRLFESTLPSPKPFDREGDRVEYHQHAKVHAMHQCVVGDLRHIRSRPNMLDARIAVLVRDTRNFNRFLSYCNSTGPDDVVQIGQEHYVDSDTVLARIPDVRGLEYDAVIVLGVNDTFIDTLFNQKMLYQATTRARHHLAIHYAGKISPILRSMSDRGIRKFDRRKK